MPRKRDQDPKPKSQKGLNQWLRGTLEYMARCVRANGAFCTESWHDREARVAEIKSFFHSMTGELIEDPKPRRKGGPCPQKVRLLFAYLKRMQGCKIPDGVPCAHPGCLSHITHPCEGCGRIGGRKWNLGEQAKADEQNCAGGADGLPAADTGLEVPLPVGEDPKAAGG